MNADIKVSEISWIGSRFDALSCIFYCDLLAALMAAMVPWSTTGFGIFLALWLLTLIPLIPTVYMPTFFRLMSRPICIWPLAIVSIAFIGMVWADVPWQERLLGVKPVAKLLLIPLLVFHFQRSRRGSWVFIAFGASCALLMLFSWSIFFAPELKLKATLDPEVPIATHLDQSQEMALCMVALLPCVIALYKQRRSKAALACAVLALGFFANMAFVALARTALVYVPAMMTLFAWRCLDRRKSLFLMAGVTILAITCWFTSPFLRTRVTDIAVEYQVFEQNTPLSSGVQQYSTGLRLEFWQKSLKFFLRAPILGNGTGSIETLFARDAIGKTGLDSEVTRNPHNQTLSMAVQWGLVGVISLYGMWLSHLFLFRGDGFANWVGSLIVVQNLFSSLLNSHLFDFHQGWIYVLGVGVAGGMSLGEKRREEVFRPNPQFASLNRGVPI
jgi:O-antigen ligase